MAMRSASFPPWRGAEPSRSVAAIGHGDLGEDMTEDENQVPEGAAVLPLIPEELGVHPLLLAVLHAVVFFDGSDADVVNDAAANEALNYFATYLQRLQG